MKPIDKAKQEQNLLLDNFNNPKKLLEWLSNDNSFNIPKDEIIEILEDWRTYNSNWG